MFSLIGLNGCAYNRSPESPQEVILDSEDDEFIISPYEEGDMICYKTEKGSKLCVRKGTPRAEDPQKWSTYDEDLREALRNDPSLETQWKFDIDFHLGDEITEENRQILLDVFNDFKERQRRLEEMVLANEIDKESYFKEMGLIMSEMIRVNANILTDEQYEKLWGEPKPSEYLEASEE